jgi:hypothetical protein
MLRTAAAVLTNAISVLVGLVASNYGYQYFAHADWGCAFERSFFQAIAIVTFALLLQARGQKR